MFNFFYNQDPWSKKGVFLTKQLKYSKFLVILNNLAFMFNAPISDKYIFSGPHKLTNSLLRMFKKEKVKYNKEHYKNSYIISYGVYGIEILKNLKKTDFESKKVLIGPLIPKENMNELFKEVKNNKNIKIVCASELMKESLISLSNNELGENNFSVIPAPISVTKKEEMRNFNTKKALVYFKKRNIKELEIVQKYLDEKDIEYKTFTYGEYNNADLMNEALESNFGIILDKSETQGIAVQELMSTNLPLFVIDYQNNEYIGLDSFEFSSVPYWSNKCGERIFDIKDFDVKMDLFIKNIQSYSPKEFIEKNLSPEQIRKTFIKEFQ